MISPLVSVICVSNRPPFIPAMLHIFKAQTYPNKQLVLVDASPGAKGIEAALESGWWMKPGDTFIYQQVKPQTPVGAMRDIGMHLAQGDLMTWMDDDGWHDPERISTLAGCLMGRELDAIGIQGLFWTDLTGQFYHYRGTPHFPLSGSMVWRRRCFERHRFDCKQVRASDHYWIVSLRGDKQIRMETVDNPRLCVGVSHGLNLSNPNPPKLARMVSTVSFRDFYPNEEFGLMKHMARIKSAAMAIGG